MDPEGYEMEGYEWEPIPAPELSPDGEPFTIPIAGFYVPPVPCPMAACELYDGHSGQHLVSN